MIFNVIGGEARLKELNKFNDLRYFNEKLLEVLNEPKYADLPSLNIRGNVNANGHLTHTEACDPVIRRKIISEISNTLDASGFTFQSRTITCDDTNNFPLQPVNVLNVHVFLVRKS